MHSKENTEITCKAKQWAKWKNLKECNKKLDLKNVGKFNTEERAAV